MRQHPRRRKVVGCSRGRETPGHPGLVRPPVIGILQRTHPSSQRRLQVRIPAPPDYETIGDERLCAQRTCLEVIWNLIQTTARPMPYGPILSYPAIWFSFFAWPHAYMPNCARLNDTLHCSRLEHGVLTCHAQARDYIAIPSIELLYGGQLYASGLTQSGLIKSPNESTLAGVI